MAKKHFRIARYKDDVTKIAWDYVCVFHDCHKIPHLRWKRRTDSIKQQLINRLGKAGAKKAIREAEFAAKLVGL